MQHFSCCTRLIPLCHAVPAQDAEILKTQWEKRQADLEGELEAKRAEKEAAEGAWVARGRVRVRPLPARCPPAPPTVSAPPHPACLLPLPVCSRAHPA